MEKVRFFAKNHKEFLIGLVLCMLSLWPLIFAPFFSHHDDLQVIRIYEIDKCIKDLQIPCRWVPDLGGLYGYPLFNYYAPLAYYYGEIFYLLIGSLLISVKIMFATAFIGSYIFMYFFARKFWGELGGVVSAVFYAFAPYHAVLLYVRGAMGELWGLMFFPAILLTLTNLYENPKISNFLMFTLSLTFLFTSHNLSTMIFIPVVLIYSIYLMLQKSQDILLLIKEKFLYYFILSLGLSFFLAGFYLLPMIWEKNLVHVETMTIGYFSYTEHFKGIRKLFLDRSWGWGSSIREVPGGEKEMLSYQIGYIHIFGWILAIFVAYKLWKINRKKSNLIIFSSLVIIASIILIHPRSVSIWDAIIPLKYLQFPWRFLGLIILFISSIAGSIFIVLSEKRKRAIFSILILVVVIFNFSYFRPEKFIQIKDEDFLTGKGWDKQIKRSIFDYLPVYAEAPPAELATSRYEILTGDIDIKDFKEGTNWIKFNADVKSHSILRLSQYYFPEWKLWLNGQETPIQYKNNNLGLMTIIFGEGNYKVELKLQDTPVRIIGNWLTIVGFFIFILTFALQFQKIKKGIFYYLNGIR